MKLKIAVIAMVTALAVTGEATPVLADGLALPPGPVYVPASKRVIEVVDRIAPAEWDVKAAVAWLDRHTASRMKLVAKCSGRAWMCVTFRSGTVAGNPIGSTKNRVITIDTAKANRGAYRRPYNVRSNRTWLLAHELGHVLDLKHAGGRQLMNPTVGSGRLALTYSQKLHLGKR